MSPLVHILRLPIHLYRYGISPLLGVNCRFAPSCSEYALEALATHGALKGGYLAARRILRCHPWGGSGYDPVPSAGAAGQDGKTATNSCTHPSHTRAHGGHETVTG
ncbi:membrane protein insertion efficiency factor YidD [Oceanibaculum indicum]|uniref:Putative membrane protein insertion efficiency factor n=2 Tax=Oceanibaculum indicum TaxID=526216 RepID=K2JUU7_9PROT|nr:membrane protein insertion efficiency factor YidD [Oceanibaculum indicum]EKE78312.1 hypothetical protein P24_02086 [Oceanibaculum indicum P24]RKQ68765.1 hypothetical protein BCL74_3248 [Oceanibaculum indicum]